MFDLIFEFNNTSSNYTLDNFKVEQLFWFLKFPEFFFVSL